jgi:hypothetical protein
VNDEQDSTIWSYVSDEGCQLSVGPDKSGDVPPRALVTIDEDGPDGLAMSVPVPAGMVPGMASAVHAAAGLPVPLILGRPDIDVRAVRTVAGYTVGFTARDGIIIRPPGRAGLRPAAARELAAVIAAYAGAAEGEPDPGEVSDLAAVIEEELACFTGQAEQMSVVAAAAALRWMRRKPAS